MNFIITAAASSVHLKENQSTSDFTAAKVRARFERFHPLEWTVAACCQATLCAAAASRQDDMSDHVGRGRREGEVELDLLCTSHLSLVLSSAPWSIAGSH